MQYQVLTGERHIETYSGPHTHTHTPDRSTETERDLPLTAFNRTKTITMSQSLSGIKRPVDGRFGAHPWGRGTGIERGGKKPGCHTEEIG